MKRTSAILRALSEKNKDQISVGDVLKQGGSRAHGLGLLMFALPETLPIPIPSLSAILAIPLVLISGHLMLFGEAGGVPKPVRDRSIPSSVVQRVTKYVAPVFEKLEHISHARFEALARRERLLGAACLLLSIILLLPIPFGNLVPAVCLVGIAFGMLQRDGVVVALGLTATAACTVAAVYMARFVGNLFT